METEDRFTPPSPWCPHPERWHSPDIDSAEDEVSGLVCAFVRALQPDLVIETGTAWGATAEAIGLVLARNGHGHLHTTETEPDRVEHSQNRVRLLPVSVHHMTSLEFEPPGPVQFAWFDSLLWLRRPEFRHYRAWMEPGTIVGFHDTAPHKSMHAKIDSMGRKGLLRPITLRTPRGVTFAEVL